jgi:hypothetical protein
MSLKLGMSWINDASEALYANGRHTVERSTMNP